jgi:hypothetical protein
VAVSPAAQPFATSVASAAVQMSAEFAAVQMSAESAAGGHAFGLAKANAAGGHAFGLAKAKIYATTEIAAAATQMPSLPVSFPPYISSRLFPPYVSIKLLAQVAVLPTSFSSPAAVSLVLASILAAEGQLAVSAQDAA